MQRNNEQPRRVPGGRIIGSARFEPYRRRPAPRRFFRQAGGADEEDGHQQQQQQQQHDAPGPIRHQRRPIFRRAHVVSPYRVADLTEEQLFERHVTIIDSYVQHVRKFNVDGYQTRFVLRDLDEADEPVVVLERVMDRLMSIAKTNAERAGYEVSHIGIAFNVEGMQSDFLIPFEPPEMNTAAKVSTAIDEKDQSEKEDSVTVYDKAMNLLITVVKKPRGAGRCPFVDDEAECSDSEGEDDDCEEEEDEDAPDTTDLTDDAPRLSRRARRQQERATVAAAAARRRRRQKPRRKIEYVPGKSVIENALIRVPRYDNRCLFYALAVSRLYMSSMYGEESREQAARTSSAYHKTMRLVNSHQRLTEEAFHMMELAGIPHGQPDYGLEDVEKVQQFFNRSWPGVFRIVVFGEHSGTKALFNGGVNAKFNLCLYHNKHHFDVVKSPAQFFDRKNYCIDCETVFSNKDTHTMHCRIKCLRCLRMGHGFPCALKDGESRTCMSCRLFFTSIDCYEHHLRHACKTYRYCETCHCIYRPSKFAKRGGHRCGENLCRTCNSYHKTHEKCFIPQLTFEKKKKKKKKGDDGEVVEEEEEEVHHRLASFDFESEIHEKITEVKERHAPNYVSMHLTCTKCIAEGDWDNFEKTTCDVCGPQKHFQFGAWELDGEGVTVVDALLEVLLSTLPRGFRIFAFAHNGGKYDTPFILKAITKRGGTMPKITARGNKIIEVRIAKTRHFNALTIRDSVMLFPMKLAECPETFDLRRDGELIMAKTFFPYRYNRAENYAMSKKEKKAFTEWYAAHQRQPFDLCAELGEYCANDSLILLYALVNFRKTFNELANGADIFSLSCTITSACLRLFRHKFLKKKTLAVVPNNGYLSGQMQSAKALFFLKWFADAHNVRMQHRDTDEGELRVPGPDCWHVDGFIPVAERRKPEFTRCNLLECGYCNDADSLEKDTVVEFLGCAWHGCPDCFPNETTLPNGLKSDVAFQKTHDRLNRIERILGCKTFRVKECAFDMEFKLNESMKAFNEQCHDTGPLNPRDAFFGGRTHPTRLYSPPTDTTKKCHKDIVSLYPSVLLKEYPVAHPHVHHCDWREGAVHWTRPEDVKVRGLIKCIVSPPTRLFLPVLRSRDDKRLLFPLCRTCARESRTESANGLKQCRHTPEQREFVTTTTHFELQEALRRGYVVTRIIETWDYEKLDDTIFAGYIKEFMKIKVEASGWEKKSVDPDDEEAKQAFVDAYATQGIHIDKEAVKLNPGLRYIAKLCLNSLWGRFAMRSDQDQVELVTKPTRMYELLDSTTKDVMSIVAVNEHCLRITWRYKKRFERADANSNLVERMDGPPGSMLDYNDTDSVIYDFVPSLLLENGGNPLREGHLLGEMTDEHLNADILEFCCGGNKQYGLKLLDHKTGQEVHKLKIRGITLNEVNSNLLPYEKFREMTLEAPFAEPVRLPTALIMRDKKFNVYTHHSSKGYVPVWRKGNVDLSDERRIIFPPGYVFTPAELS